MRLPFNISKLGNQYLFAFIFAKKIPASIPLQASFAEVTLATKAEKLWHIGGNKKWQATYITPLRPSTLAAFPPWGIQQELVV